MQRKTLALVFCAGGPLSASPASWERVRRPADMARWLAHMPELNLLADIEPVFVNGGSPSDVGPAEWQSLAETVRKVARRVDGVLVLHGIETINYTANALSLMMKTLPLPVVLSGSPNRAGGRGAKPAEFGARANVINAAQVAVADLAGVFVVFGNRIMSGSRVQLELVDGALHVTTADRSLVGRIDFGITLAAERMHRGKRPVVIADGIEPNLYTMTTAPGSMQPLRRAVETGLKGILVRSAQDYLALAPEMLALLRSAAGKGIPVIIATPNPVMDLPKEFLTLSGVSAGMAVVKSMWAIGNSKNRGALRALLSRDIAGERMPHGGTV